MLDKIFTFLNKLAQKVSSTKFSGISRNRIYLIILLLIALYQGGATYYIGECINCDELSREKAMEMMNNGTLTDNELTQWYQTRNYIPFNSVGKFIKAWLISSSGPIIVFSLMFFIMYFIFNVIKNKLLNFKQQKIKEALNNFSSYTKINKK